MDAALPENDKTAARVFVESQLQEAWFPECPFHTFNSQDDDFAKNAATSQIKHAMHVNTVLIFFPCVPSIESLLKFDVSCGF